jgi:hypothetical protein
MAAGTEWKDGKWFPKDYQAFNPQRWLADWLDTNASSFVGSATQGQQCSSVAEGDACGDDVAAQAGNACQGYEMLQQQKGASMAETIPGRHLQQHGEQEQEKKQEQGQEQRTDAPDQAAAEPRV